MTALRAVPGSPLDELVATINAEHQRVHAAAGEMLDHAIRCGQALLQAQAQVPRGQWLDWLVNDVEPHPTTAYRYMRVAEHEQAVRASGATSIAGAMRELADVPRRGHGPRGYSNADKEQWLRLVQQFGIKPTAKALGISPSTIWKWTSRKSPDTQRAHMTEGTFDRNAEVTDEMIDAIALWLVNKFGSEVYPVRVTDQVRADALEIIGVFLEAA